MHNSILGIGAINLYIILKFKKGETNNFPTGKDIDEQCPNDDIWWKKFVSVASERHIYCCGGGSAANTICSLAVLDNDIITGFLVF